MCTWRVVASWKWKWLVLPVLLLLQLNAVIVYAGEGAYRYWHRQLPNVVAIGTGSILTLGLYVPHKLLGIRKRCQQLRTRESCHDRSRNGEGCQWQADKQRCGVHGWTGFRQFLRDRNEQCQRIRTYSTCEFTVGCYWKFGKMLAGKEEPRCRVHALEAFRTTRFPFAKRGNEPVRPPGRRRRHRGGRGRGRGSGSGGNGGGGSNTNMNNLSESSGRKTIWSPWWGQVNAAPYPQQQQQQQHHDGTGQSFWSDMFGMGHYGSHHHYTHK